MSDSKSKVDPEEGAKQAAAAYAVDQQIHQSNLAGTAPVGVAPTATPVVDTDPVRPAGLTNEPYPGNPIPGSKEDEARREEAAEAAKDEDKPASPAQVKKDTPDGGNDAADKPQGEAPADFQEQADVDPEKDTPVTSGQLNHIDDPKEDNPDQPPTPEAKGKNLGKGK